MLIAEVWASIVTGSLALWSDAGHMLADLTGLILAAVALRLASRPADKQASFGYQRYEVLAAAANGWLLVGMVVLLVYTAIRRLVSPLAELDTSLVLMIATLGLLANLIAAYFLARDAKENINTKGALWNVLGDSVASLGVIIATLLVHFTGNTSWDTYVTFLVAAIIMTGAWRLLKQTGAILLESTPPDIDLAQVKAEVERLHDVVNVHDLHCWTLTPGQHSLTMHVSITQNAVQRFHDVTQTIEGLLADRWGLHHCTIQVEPVGEDPVSDAFDPVNPSAAQIRGAKQ